MTAVDFCLSSAGGFFLVGLVTGIWKYACIVRSPGARAPFYVDTAHRASLLYAFACALMAQLCEHSAWSSRTNLRAAVVLVVFFAAAVLGYVVHGALRDTENQLQRPHVLAGRTIPAPAVLAFMILLATAELAGFAVIYGGYLAARSS